MTDVQLRRLPLKQSDAGLQPGCDHGLRLGFAVERRVRPPGGEDTLQIGLTGGNPDTGGKQVGR